MGRKNDLAARLENRIKETMSKYLKLLSLKADKNVLDMLLKEISYLKDLRNRVLAKNK
jgi:hypothetical protein